MFSLSLVAYLGVVDDDDDDDEGEEEEECLGVILLGVRCRSPRLSHYRMVPPPPSPLSLSLPSPSPSPSPRPPFIL